jgi:hypothetical protein
VRALNQPESWWGWHGYNQPQPLSIVEILQAGTMPARVAALFWLAVERGASIIFAADPPGAGKTTILTALLAFARPEARVYFTRGWGETFRLPPPDPGAPTYLLVNEISDHLPVYSWGPYVQRAFELMAEGYSLASTMHADTVDQVVEQLLEENDVRQEHIGHLSFVVPLFVGVRDGRRVRRVAEVAALEPLGKGYDRCSLVRWRAEEDAYEVLTTPAEINAAARRVRMEDDEFIRELARREEFLQRLLVEGVTGTDEVQARVLEFGGHGASGGLTAGR